jgi:hypothetical protein
MLTGLFCLFVLEIEKLDNKLKYWRKKRYIKRLKRRQVKRVTSRGLTKEVYLALKKT